MLNRIGMQHRHLKAAFRMRLIPLGDRLNIGIAMDSGENPKGNPVWLTMRDQCYENGTYNGEAKDKSGTEGKSHGEKLRDLGQGACPSVTINGGFQAELFYL